MIAPTVAAVAAAIVIALPLGVTRGPSAGGITEYRLPNGLKVLIRPDPARPGIAVGVLYHVGWYDERAGERGVAHLLEHLGFTGTDRHPRLRREITANGADVGASTQAERTQFGFVVPPTERALRWAIDVEADRMLGLRLDASLLDAQRRIVQNEVGQAGPSLEGRVRATAFDYSAYANRGQNADLADVTVASVRAFHARHYRPSNAVLTIDGPVEEPATIAMIAEIFARVPARTAPARVAVGEPPPASERQVIVSAHDSPRVVAAYRAPGFAHPDFPAMELLLRAITVRGGRLHQEIVGSGAAASVRWSTSLTRHPDLATITAPASSDSSVDRVAELMRRALDDLSSRPPTGEEIDRGRPKPSTNEVSAADAAVCETAGDWRLCLIRDQRMAAVTADDVRRVAQTYLVPANRTVGILRPMRNAATVSIPEGDAKSTVARFDDLPPAPARAERFVATAANIAARLRDTTLASGLRIRLLPKRTNTEQVTGVLSLDFGDEASLTGRVAAGEMLARVMEAAAGADFTIVSRPRPTRVTMDPFIDLAERSMPYRGTGLDVRFRTDRRRLDDVLRTIEAMLRTPVLADSTLDRLKRQQAGLVRDRTGLRNADFTFDGLFPAFAPGHPERVQSLDERSRTIAAVSLSDLREFHEDFYGAGSGTLSVVGDFNPDSVATMAAELFGSWRSRVAPRQGVSYVTLPSADSVIQAPAGTRGEILLGLLLPVGSTHPDYPALVVANFILGGNVDSRLFNGIRERDGLSYSVSSRLRPRVGEDASLFLIEATYDVANAERVRTRLREEIGRVREHGFTAEEVAVARQGYLARLLMRRGDDAALALQLTTSGPNEIMKLERAIASVDVSAVNGAFRKHIRPDSMSSVRVVGPHS